MTVNYYKGRVQEELEVLYKELENGELPSFMEMLVEDRIEELKLLLKNNKR